ncbi:apoptosis associated tyrosine kinase [Rhinolophus ferrumequinum]|uniref:non-specific serine/threonine protein kinase n=1 Tax=Rhinolophus ferrumequinum TaxID=59479 RepID=A0A7J7TBL3_RHIFE|nr:apoptosis associated tyrosine kinase [Rhinolophus ferrumequinum]
MDSGLPGSRSRGGCWQMAVVGGTVPGLQEFENAEGEEYPAGFSAQGSPAATAQNGPDVYVLPLTEVSLPMAKQPGRSVQLLKATDLGRHSLLYLEEIGHGWFGKVFLGEVSSGIISTQVVVKELKASASVHEQVQFLEEAQPYRALQHGNLLQCLAQCTEVTPYLLVMEFCPMGDLKGYLRSCQVAESMAPDPLTLQRMACELACGVLHLHRNNYVHSDLALRNCLLTADLTVKIGDYGLSHGKYREDYFVTADQLWVPLRWIAPELVDEVHSNLLVVDQTKASNVWSLGVTIWELFELGAQPYPHHSDRQVLAYAVREQQLKLPKPQLQLTLSDRWYEVMQFCWLQPEQRPTAEEVHLLLSYLCAKGTTEAEEEFELRWRSLRPGGGGPGPGPGAACLALGGAGELAAASSFPLLEQFTGDSFHADCDDVLTVTETSRGLNFEYKWEAGRGAEAFPPPGGAPSPGHTAHLQELCAPDGAPPGVVPVLSAHSPSVGSEYFIRLEEPAPVAGHDLDCAGCAPSPLAAALTSQGSDRNEDSDGSAITSLAMEPLLGQAPPTTTSPWGHCDHYPCRSVTQDPPRLARPPSPKALMLAEPGLEDTAWGVATFCPPFFEDPLGTSPSGTSGAQRSLGKEEEPGEAEARRAAQQRHWSSNMSANNNSGSRAPESWDPGYAGGYMDGCPGRKQTLRAVPELGHPLAPEDPREPLLGPEGASFGQKPGLCLGLPHLCPAEGLAPATSLVTSPWTEAAVSGGNSPQTQPRLLEEAEGSAGPQLPLPSIPSPSQEGAPLPTEEASAPTALPALPTPASSWATAKEVAQTLDSGSSFLELEAQGSEDEDTTEATSGVFTDLSSDGLQAEKLDVMPAFRSLQKQVGTPDSLDSLDIPSSASDGGCEVFSPSVVGTSGGQPRALDSGYDTENYESPEFVLKETHEPCEPEVFGELASESESPGAESQLSASLSSFSEKNPYRDSAYFSDLDTEPETPVGPEKRGGGVPAPGPELDLESGQSSGLQPVQPSSESGVSGEAQSPGPREVPPLPLCEDSSLEPRACSTGPRPEPLWPQGPAQVPPVPRPGRSKTFLLTPVPPNSESHRPELQEAQGLLSALQERTGGPGTPRSPLCLALPGLPTAPEGRQEDDEDDSEDSEESDEELRCYSVQEPSEESEEEAPPVPVVVAESQSARNLRSLLKMPSLLSQAFCEDLERKKKAVSFFDDVTVYLFDQESPTRELGEPFPGAKESPPALLAGSPSSPSVPCRPRHAEGSPDGFAVEPGRRFEWDDGLPLTPSQQPALATPTAPSKAAAPRHFSRFTVSPAPASRFSITHVSDSDAGSVGGPAGGAGSSCKEA